MGFLRRLLGREPSSPSSESPPVEDQRGADADADAEERARDRDLLREEQERLDDLARRQLRYAEYAWEPPAQGGERRADDTDPTEGR
jgi:hypothetical protein